MNAIELLTAGATLSATTFATEAVKDAYKSLRRLLVNDPEDHVLPASTADSAEPTPELRQALLSKESSREVQDALLALLAAIKVEPSDHLMGARIDLQRLTVGSDVIVENSKVHGGIGVSDSKIDGTLRISDATVGESKKKPKPR